MFARYAHLTSYPNIIRKDVPNVAFFYTERHIPIEIILINRNISKKQIYLPLTNNPF
ncbi:hypothetical protein M074_4358 [Bacteroides fragilis str. DS-166]|nr:hypothetical protein M074_4358 [Bacteroides fragilis str. DS-166]